MPILVNHHRSFLSVLTLLAGHFKPLNWLQPAAEAPACTYANVRTVSLSLPRTARGCEGEPWCRGDSAVGGRDGGGSRLLLVWLVGDNTSVF